METLMTLAYRTAPVDGLKVFYREAGDPNAPTVLLLHGFPTSSHMFRDLIPALADRYHVGHLTYRASASPTRRTARASDTASITWPR